MNKLTHAPLVVMIALSSLALTATALEAMEARSAPLSPTQESFYASSSGLEGNLSREAFVAEPIWLSTGKAACHFSAPSCGSAYSCGSWSSYSNCGDPVCGGAAGCGEGPCPGPYCFGHAMLQFTERFRICFNQASESCVEYQQSGRNIGCGC